PSYVCSYFNASRDHRDLHSFPTRRSSDLIAAGHSGYRFVHASAGIGDVNGDGYGETSGWLGKTLKYHGDGKYELRAHVGVGDIKDRKSTRLNSSHLVISYAVFCLKKKKL